MQALAGVRVIEFCQIAAGPFAGLLLADLGADVVKVESPEGDGMRQWPPLTGGYSENFASLNRNKRAVMLNLKDPADQEVALQMCRQADVVIENFRPGVMKRMNLSYERLSKLNPALVYCSISAFGQEGVRAQEGGFDVTIQAIAGVMSVTGEPRGAPVKCGVPISDFAAGLYAAFSIVSALRHVEQGNPGCHIDVPMLGATLGIAALQVSELFGNGRDPCRLGSAHPRNAPYQAFRCADGYFVMAAGNNELFRKACEALAKPSLAAEPAYANQSLRAANQDRLRTALEECFASMTAEQCLNVMRKHGVPCAPLNTYSQALSDPQVAEYGWVQPMALPGGAMTRSFSMPVRFNRQTPAVRRRPPELGEHNEEVLSELAASSTTSSL